MVGVVSTDLEAWRPVIGWPEYQVSDLGRVRSIDRTASNGRKMRGRILSQTSKSGYPKVTLCRAGDPVGYCVHTLVLEAFHGPCPDGMEARHLDNVRANCRASNLEWSTHAVNMADRFIFGTTGRGEAHPSVKLSAANVQEIRSLRANGVSRNDVAAKFGISSGHVASIDKGRRWGHLAAMEVY